MVGRSSSSLVFAIRWRGRPTRDPALQAHERKKNVSISGSVADPLNFGTDPDPRIFLLMDTYPGLAIFVSDLRDVNKYFFSKFFCLLRLKVHLHHFSKIKVIKKSQNRTNQYYSYYFA
jgi:hypothetical protein